MALQGDKKSKLSAIVLSEPLSAETESKRKNLLFTSCFSILLVVYGLKVNRTPWLEFEVPEGAPNILHGALSVALVYTFIVFALYAAADLRRWYMAGDLLNLNSYWELLLSSRQSLYGVTQWLEKDLPSEKSKRESVEKMYEEAFEFFEEIDAKIKKARHSHTGLSVIQWLRLLVLDLGIPFGLGIFAMCKISAALPLFIEVAFK